MVRMAERIRTQIQNTWIFRMTGQGLESVLMNLVEARLQLLPAKTTASGRVTRRASSDPACFSHSGQGLARLSHDIG